MMRERLRLLAKLPQTGVTLSQIAYFGRSVDVPTLFKGACFLREELPIRLAHRVVELEELPHGLSAMPSIQKVRQWYFDSFADVLHFTFPQELLSFNDSHASFPSGTHIDWKMRTCLDNFTDMLKRVKRRHDNVVPEMARGLLEWRTKSPEHQISSDTQGFLDRFFMSRIGIRVLMGQFAALREQLDRPNDIIGIIDRKTDVLGLARAAAIQARDLCLDYYPGMVTPPQVKFYAPPDSRELEFTYIPQHLHHMLIELLKNSLRATVEHANGAADLPDVKVILARGKEDVTIKVSDEGGGIPRSAIPLVWRYMYTTARTPPPSQFDDYRPLLAGFGYGLPLCRLYARYFGGDLRLISMEGYGTDAYLHLSRLSDFEEPLYA